MDTRKNKTRLLNKNYISPPVFVIGISGATWTLIDLFSTQGLLPNIQRLKQNGSYGVFESVKPKDDKHYRPHTAWPSLMTGFKPEKHGQNKFYSIANDLSTPALWNYFEERKKKIGLFGLPLLWPPYHVDGFIIPSPYGRDNKTWPPGLSYIRDFYIHHQRSKSGRRKNPSLAYTLKLIQLFLKYKKNLGLLFQILPVFLRLCMTKRKEERTLLMRELKLFASTSLFASLYQKYNPHFSVFTNFVIDFVSHRYWRYMETEKFNNSNHKSSPRLHNAVRTVYRQMDKYIGFLLKMIPEESILSVVSEHGMSPEVEQNELGNWQLLIHPEKLKKYLDLDERFILLPIARWIIIRNKDGSNLDNKLTSLLQNIIIIETGLLLFNVYIHSSSEIIIKFNLTKEKYGKYSNNLEGLQIQLSNHNVISLKEITVRAGPTRSAMHDKNGIFIMKGPGIKTGHIVSNAKITDFTPTILHAAGMDIPAHLDGDVLDIFT